MLNKIILTSFRKHAVFQSAVPGVIQGMDSGATLH